MTKLYKAVVQMFFNLVPILWRLLSDFILYLCLIPFWLF